MVNLQPGADRRRFRAPAAIFWVAFGLRLAGILIGHTYRIRPIDNHFDFGFEAGRIAQSLATGHGYSNPFNGNSGPTAWLPPLYPLLLALCFKLFGIYTRAAAFAIMALDSLFSALIAPAIYEIAARCLDAHNLARRASQKAAPVALWSAWIWAVYPGAMQYAVHWVWEMSLSACLFTWAFVMALRLRQIGQQKDVVSPTRATSPAALHEAPEQAPGTHPRWALWCVFGTLWGCIVLSNASLALMLPASLVWILWPLLPFGNHARSDDLPQALAGAAAACVVFGLVLTPWVIRNERTLHAFVLTRDNMGVELWQSSRFDRNGSLNWGTSLPLSPLEPEFQRYVQQGEVRYAAEKGAIAKQTIRTHPGRFLAYTLQRVQFFWFCTPHPPEKHPVLEYLRVLLYAATSLAGLLGLALMLRHHTPASALFGLAILLVPLVYYAVTVQPRFRHPLEPLLTIAAVYLFRSTSR